MGQLWWGAVGGCCVTLSQGWFWEWDLGQYVVVIENGQAGVGARESVHVAIVIIELLSVSAGGWYAE